MYNQYDYRHTGGDKQASRRKYFHLTDLKTESAITYDWKEKGEEVFSVHFETSVLELIFERHVHIFVDEEISFKKLPL